MKLKFNRLAENTFGRIRNVTVFLSLLDDAIPIVTQRETEALKQQAEEEGRDYGEYQIDAQVLDAQFAQWMPRFAAYSCVILLYSIVDTQLHEYAEHLGKKLNSTLRVEDMRGPRGIEQTKLYLSKVVGVDVAHDPNWADIDDLRELRNIIVHRGGRPSNAKKQQELVARLCKKYGAYLSIPQGWPPDDHVWVSMRLCSRFATTINEFFTRLFKAAGLSDKSAEFV